MAAWARPPGETALDEADAGVKLSACYIDRGDG